MRKEVEHVPDRTGRRVDFLLWVAILLPLFAMGANTVVGYTVAHWACGVHQNRDVFIVSVVDLVVCLIALSIAFTMQVFHLGTDDSGPTVGRRSFMAKIALLLGGIAILLIVAGTLAPIILHPCD